MRRSHLEQALAIDDFVSDREFAFRFGQDVASVAMLYLALTLRALGFPDRAGSMIEKAVIRASETKHIPTTAYAYAHAGIFEVLRRDCLRAAPHLEKLLGLAREYGIPVWIAFGTFQQGWARWGAGDHEAGRAEMHEGLALMRLQLIEIFMPLSMTLLAETEAEAGRPGAGLAIVDGQLEAIKQTGQCWFLSDLHRARGEILLKCQPPDAAAAESAFMRAIDIARGQTAKLLELKAAIALGRLWMAEGRSDKARELVAPIWAWFGANPDCDALGEVSALLDDMARR